MKKLIKKPKLVISSGLAAALFFTSPLSTFAGTFNSNGATAVPVSLSIDPSISTNYTVAIPASITMSEDDGNYLRGSGTVTVSGTFPVNKAVIVRPFNASVDNEGVITDASAAEGASLVSATTTANLNALAEEQLEDMGYTDEDEWLEEQGETAAQNLGYASLEEWRNDDDWEDEEIDSRIKSYLDWYNYNDLIFTDGAGNEVRGGFWAENLRYNSWFFDDYDTYFETDLNRNNTASSTVGAIVSKYVGDGDYTAYLGFSFGLVNREAGGGNSGGGSGSGGGGGAENVWTDILTNAWYGTNTVSCFENGDGDMILFLMMNPAVNGTTITYTIDSNAVTPTYSDINGDGNYIARFNVNDLASGSHTVTVSAEGFDPVTKSFTKP